MAAIVLLCQNPALMKQLLQQADAIFINGGDQSLTMRSLQFSSGTQAGEFTALGKLLQQKIIILYFYNNLHL